MVASRFNEISGTRASESGLPKFVDHPELHDESLLQQLVDETERLLNTFNELSWSDEIILFKSLHACRLLARPSQETQSRWPHDRQHWVTLHERICERLARRNIGLIYSMRSRFRVPASDDDELFSEGFSALHRSILAFNPWRGFRFSTYACNSIYYAFLRVSRAEDRRKKVMKNTEEWVQETAVAAASEEGYEGGLLAERLNVILDQNAADLTHMERLVLDRRFPRSPDTLGLSLEKLSKITNVSKETVRKIQRTALEKLRTALISDPVLQ